MKQLPWLVLAAAAMAATAPFAVAHFRLMEPASWLVENNLGDPQKLGPCGGTTANGGMPSNAVTKVQGGQKLHIKLQETVFHPGHYRIALAVNARSELPPDPEATTRDSEKGPWSVSAPISSPVKPPVLADGLWQHTSKQADPWETDVTLPNINCPHCTLQITEFMAEHGYNKDGGYYYHHCADLAITADASKPVDKGWPAAK
ncbi:MAG TPA: SCE4755 family polysaccharide monooxygenase-like protein [Bryobacteraceae bacterium]|nr:SCE4755 family polysaccharide monooxygenase-like protein [Bryobacteraceae bacterium]